MRLVQTESGLILPAEPQSVPKRDYGPLEVKDKETRELLQRAFERILARHGGGIKIPREDDLTEEQREAIFDMAYKLLGNDFGFEELC
jgi:hypothetical protein